jgi:hypothetical protein
MKNRLADFSNGTINKRRQGQISLRLEKTMFKIERGRKYLLNCSTPFCQCKHCTTEGNKTTVVTCHVQEKVKRFTGFLCGQSRLDRRSRIFQVWGFSLIRHQVFPCLSSKPPKLTGSSRKLWSATLASISCCQAVD